MAELRRALPSPGIGPSTTACPHQALFTSESSSGMTLAQFDGLTLPRTPVWAPVQAKPDVLTAHRSMRPPFGAPKFRPPVFWAIPTPVGGATSDDPKKSDHVEPFERPRPRVSETVQGSPTIAFELVRMSGFGKVVEFNGA